MKTLYEALRVNPLAAHAREMLFIRLAREYRRQARLSLASYLALGFLSGCALFPTLSYTSTELYTSGFGDYLSLMYNNFSVYKGATQNFLYLTLEALPSFALLLTFGISGLFLWSLRGAFRNGNRALITLKI